jgi:tape measure domain-containing protein
VSGALATIGAVAVFRDLINSATQLENITRKLSNTLGESGATQAIGELRGLSDRLGISFTVLADSFGSFTAAASAANIPLSEQKELFAAVSTSAQRLGLSNDAINGSLLALQQIAAKGVVQMEELRGQLGERLPTAFSAAARGLGLTSQELIKLVESGRLTADQFFPALTKGLNELNGGGSSLPTAAQNFASLANEVEKLKAAIGQELLPGVLAFTQALASGLQGAVKNELGETTRSIAFLKDTIADQTEFGVDTTEAERKLAQLQIKAEELQDQISRLGRVEEIKTETLQLERQRRELERQGVATDAITEKTRLLSKELFLLTGSTESVKVGQVFNGLFQEQITITPVVTEQLKEARAEQEKINSELAIQRAARERVVAVGRDTAEIDARILRLQERSRGVQAGIGVAALDRIQRERDAKIAEDRRIQEEDSKRLNTLGKIEARLRTLREQNKGLDIGSSQFKENQAEIAQLEAQTAKGAQKLEDAGKKIREEIEKGAAKLAEAGERLQKANENIANAILSNADIATEKALAGARRTLEGEIRRDQQSGLIDPQKFVQKFGGSFDSGQRVVVGQGGTIRQQQVRPPSLDLSSLSTQQLQQAAAATGALADANKALQDAQIANTEATKENNRLLGLVNGRESNLTVTVPVGGQKQVYLP